MSTQPNPAPNGTTPIWNLVIADMQARDRVGRERYGTPLQAGNGRDALQDAYEESLDKTVYLKQAIVERDELRDRIKAELIRMRTYVMHHGALVGECVAWNSLKAMFGVGNLDQDDLAWLQQYERKQKA